MLKKLGTVIATDVTVPDPAGVAQVPSPRQKVVEPALVPEFKLLTGKFPVMPPLEGEARLIGGTSALTIARGVIAPEDPLGAARKKFAVSEVPVIASVPDAVTGEPLTVSQLGAVIATEVTVPEPLAVRQEFQPLLYSSTCPLLQTGSELPDPPLM
jgi:hypothetical protein